jgi:hypothetical protein
MRMTLITLVAFTLNLIDLIITVYCINNVPGCFEMNPNYPVSYYDDIKYKDEILKKMTFDKIKNVDLVVIGLVWDIMKRKIRVRLVEFCYNIFSLIFLSIIIFYIYIVVCNIIVLRN